MIERFLVRPTVAGYLVKPGIIAAILFLAYYLGQRASVSYMLFLVAIVGGSILLLQPALGLVILLVSSVSLPFSVGTGTQTSLHAGILLIPVLLTIWVLRMISHRSIRLVPSCTNLPIVAFILSATISLLAGTLPWDYFALPVSVQAQVGGWAVFAFSAGLFLFVGNQVKDLRWLRVLVWMFLSICAVYVGGQALPPLAQISSRVVVQAVVAQSVFWVWLVALAGGLALFNGSLSWQVRVALVVLAVGTFAEAWFLNRSWISGWFPMLVVILTLIWLRSWRLGLLVTAIGLIGTLLFRPDFLASIVSGDRYSADSRMAAWQVLLANVIPLSPIIGLGPANYYSYTSLFPLWGYYVRFNSHNQYIDILAQTGILGLVLFGWVMAATARLGWSLRTRVSNGFARGYVYACLAGLAGMVVAGCLGDWVLPFVYNIGLAGSRASLLGWLFLGGLVAIEEMTHKNSPPEKI